MCALPCLPQAAGAAAAPLVLALGEVRFYAALALLRGAPADGWEVRAGDRAER